MVYKVCCNNLVKAYKNDFWYYQLSFINCHRQLIMSFFVFDKKSDVQNDFGFAFDQKDFSNATVDEDIEIGKDSYEQLHKLATPTDFECWDSEEVLDETPVILSKETDSNFWDSDEDICDDAITEVISRKYLDDEEDYISEKSVHELIAEITASFDQSTILDDSEITASFDQSTKLADSSHPNHVADVSNCADKCTDDTVFFVDEPMSNAPGRKAPVPMTPSRDAIKRSNQDLKSDGLYQPIQHLLSQK